MRLRPLSVLKILLIALHLDCAFAGAWSTAGHMAIAAEAFRELSPKFKHKVTVLLKAHPDYETWTQAYAKGPANVELPVYIFLRASAWPDEIRRRGNAYDHPHWHYINYPLEPPKFPVKPGPAPQDDILFGIAQSETTLADKRATPEQRAVALSYLIHLIGDLHQPLHCGMLINEIYFPPEGEAIRLQAELPRKTLRELKNKTPEKWSLEGRKLAVEEVYRHGKLQGSTNPDTAPGLPADYPKTAKLIAERRAALAGYRLADEIQEYVR